jgi:hypothetical protein
VSYAGILAYFLRSTKVKILVIGVDFHSFHSGLTGTDAGKIDPVDNRTPLKWSKNYFISPVRAVGIRRRCEPCPPYLNVGNATRLPTDADSTISPHTRLYRAG